MINLFFNNKKLSYTNLVMKDSGHDFTLGFAPNSTNLIKGDMVKVSYATVSYDFMVYYSNSSNVSLRIFILEELKNKNITGNTKGKMSLSTALSFMGCSDYITILNDLNVENFAFSGTVYELLSSLCFEYGLKFYERNNRINLYKDRAKLPTKRHSEKILEGSSIALNLAIRAFDIVNEEQVKEVVHTPLKGLTRLIYF